MAHNEPELLQILVSLIDDPRNDIYIMVDAKADIRQFEGITCQHSKIEFCKNRIKVYWAHISQVENELNLLNSALEQGEYSYFHLLSGVDMPLKTQDYIHNFCNTHKGQLFIRIKTGEKADSIVHAKFDTYHFFDRYMRHPNPYVKRIANYGRLLLNICQRKIGVRRRYMFGKLSYGDNWVSLPEDFVSNLLTRRDDILREFRHTSSADEVYKQTLAVNTHFRERLYNGGCMRKVDWNRGGPYTWTEKDYEELIQSDDLFARKFSTQVDRNIIDQIRDYLKR